MDSEYLPIEVTTHNLYFHEESPVLSIDTSGGIFATSGNDNTIRLWKPSYKPFLYKENIYKTASNSSIKIDLIDELKGFTRPINCVRFYEPVENKEEYILAACADGGKVIVYKNNQPHVVRSSDGDDAFDLCWGDSELIVTFSSGRVEVYKMEQIESKPNDAETNDLSSLEVLKENSTNLRISPVPIKIEKNESLKFTLILNQKIHDSTITGVAYNRKYNCIATHSFDKTLKVHLISNSLIHVTTHSHRIDNSRSLFKRFLFSEDILYVINANNSVSLFSYPFGAVHLHKKIGPLNSPVIKIVKEENLLFLCTKKSVYVFDDDKLIFCVDNACFMAITDGFFVNNTLFVSSMDGFISSIRLSSK